MADTSALTKRIVLFGSRGMVGSALAEALSSRTLEAYTHKDVDITDYAAVERIFRKVRPEIVINAAAFTRVDDCEKFREPAYLANVQAVAQIAGLCKKYDAMLVQFSTDYIFDGNTEVPYAEESPANPINYYGATKWEGDKKVISSGCRFLIMRSSWVFGRNGDNFVKKILKRALAGAKLRAPSDQYGAPTYSDDIAAAVIKLLASGAEKVVNFTNTGQCSRLEQARIILQSYGLNNSIEAVKNDDLHLLARRPRFSVLDISRYRQLTGHTPRNWQLSTAEYIAYLKQNEQELRS